MNLFKRFFILFFFISLAGSVLPTYGMSDSSLALHIKDDISSRTVNSIHYASPSHHRILTELIEITEDIHKFEFAKLVKDIDYNPVCLINFFSSYHIKNIANCPSCNFSNKFLTSIKIYLLYLVFRI